MPDRKLVWPFFEQRHRRFAFDLNAWLRTANPRDDETDADASVQDWVRALGADGWLKACTELDVRTLCLAREILAYTSALGDFAFAMQGLGSGAITLFGTPEQRATYLPRVEAGSALAAFALSERDAGSDVAAIATTARADGNEYVLDGQKTWISNAGIADFYIVFARTALRQGQDALRQAQDALRQAQDALRQAQDDSGRPSVLSERSESKGQDDRRGLSAFIVEAGIDGFDITERIETISPHPLGTLRFSSCRIPASALIGAEGDGFKIAMATLDVFRTTVGAAALGFARRAFDETRAHAKSRRLFGAPLAALQMTQAAIADMAVDVDASELLVYRAAWTKDSGAERVTREAAIAKLFATEAAGRVCDRAVQLFGGRGVSRGEIVERLYRDVRALRIYEGASEIQRIVIARASLEA